MFALGALALFMTLALLGLTTFALGVLAALPLGVLALGGFMACAFGVLHALPHFSVALFHFPADVLGLLLEFLAHALGALVEHPGFLLQTSPGEVLGGLLEVFELLLHLLVMGAHFLGVFACLIGLGPGFLRELVPDLLPVGSIAMVLRGGGESEGGSGCRRQ
jgi:hypothetical protein